MLTITPKGLSVKSQKSNDIREPEIWTTSTENFQDNEDHTI